MRHLVVVLLALVGCDRKIVDISDQRRLDTYEGTGLFADGAAARPLVHGVVPRPGARDSDGGLDSRPEVLQAALDPRSALRRGRQRYEIFCLPCHGQSGAGDGLIVQRGYPAPPSFHTPRLREATDEHLLRVVTNGLGKMPPYREQVPEADRGVVVAWIRLLQVSQHAQADALPAEVRAAVEAGEADRGR